MPHCRAARTHLPLTLLMSAALASGCDSTSPSPAPEVPDAGAGASLDASPATLDAAANGGDSAIPDAADGATVTVDAAGAATVDAADANAETSLDGAPIPDATVIDAAPDAALDSDAPDATFESIAALSFDGVDDWVHLPTIAGAASETAFSVELWFRTTSQTGNMFEVYGQAGGADRFISLNGGTVCFYVYASPITQICTTAATYGDGGWHYAAGTLGAGGVNLYVDGAPAASSTAITASTFTGDTDFRLGMGHTFFVSPIVFFQGDIDEVRVWSVERSATDIAANYRHTIDPTTTGLQGYWKLDESGTAAVAADATSNPNNGQLMNFTFSPSPWIIPGAF